MQSWSKEGPRAGLERLKVREAVPAVEWEVREGPRRERREE